MTRVNFLLHRELAIAELGSPAAGVGAMLPDLWRMADRRVRPSRELLPEGQGVARALAEGVHHHLAADEWFHAASVFLEGERATVTALRGSGVARMGLFAHVAWELLLDGALVRARGVERVQSELLRSFAPAMPAIEPLADRHHFERAGRPSSEQSRFHARMRGLCERLASGPWIAHYATADGVAMILGRIRERVGVAGLTEGEQALVAASIAPLHEAADGAFQQITEKYISTNA